MDFPAKIEHSLGAEASDPDHRRSVDHITRQRRQASTALLTWPLDIVAQDQNLASQAFSLSIREPICAHAPATRANSLWTIRRHSRELIKPTIERGGKLPNAFSR